MGPVKSYIKDTGLWNPLKLTLDLDEILSALKFSSIAKPFIKYSIGDHKDTCDGSITGIPRVGVGIFDPTRN